MSSVGDNIRRIREEIAEAALRSGRDPSAVRLMAVTKTVDDARILEAIEAGVDIMGENYVQEAKRKIETMAVDVKWHMIGHLQSNKAKYAIRLFDMIHSIDRLGLAEELDRRSAAAGRVTDVLVEVKVSGEESKSGIPAEEAPALVRKIASLDNLSIRGLMTMPPWFEDPENARPYFAALRKLRDRIADEEIPGVDLRELSMGMSADYRVAVEEGATIVRIGTAIFGPRA